MARKHGRTACGTEQQRSKTTNDSETDELSELKLMLMTTMAEMNITPEEYASFLENDETRAEQAALLRSMAEDYGLTDDSRCVAHIAGETADSIPDADKKSLRLKVQMKDVSKPPMWREIVIPADFNFLQLHYAIQAVMNFDDSHLWRFGRGRYNSDLSISIQYDDDMDCWLDSRTHDAEATPVTGFLAQKGDKLEYTYDFGDDWIFTVTVLEVMERNGDVAVCTKWKCDFQPIEDCGGIWSYLQLREAFSSPDAMTPKQKKDLAETFGFTNFPQLSAWLDEATLNIEHIHERLAEIG
ncbi:MAG: plasmid pRiA4b ORF-3 family protein [Muribaculaceae bacterium]|nr:plasmid pRiA4b ORF-3 family protein [Muribaculaceae bacterium]MBP3639600.1 plasmid pRiA4b ORF-3 family protein [Muribaculaceae bacterium]